ncbi:MAG: DUF5666 domain-containing protein [Leifsonia sp.]
MSNTQPTEPLPPRPENATPPPAAGPAPTGTAPAGAPPEPFYKRHGLAFAISTLVLSVVILLGLFTAGAFAVANVVTHVGERAISRVLPQGQQPGVPGMPGIPGRPGDGDENGNGGKGDGNGQMGHVMVRGTIASISGDTWTVDRDGGASVKVKVDSSTVFGVPGQSASKSDFASGDEVVVIGTRSGGTVTATRVLKLTGFPTRPPSTPGPATPGS